MAQARQKEEVKKQQCVIHGEKLIGNQVHNIDDVIKNSRQRRDREKFAERR